MSAPAPATVNDPLLPEADPVAPTLPTSELAQPDGSDCPYTRALPGSTATHTSNITTRTETLRTRTSRRDLLLERGGSMQSTNHGSASQPQRIANSTRQRMQWRSAVNASWQSGH